MNLKEVTQLINQLIAENDPTNADLIAFYQKKRVELLAMIDEAIHNNLKSMNLDRPINKQDKNFTFERVSKHYQEH